MQSAIDMAVHWGATNGLTFGPLKSVPVVFTLGRKGHEDFPQLRLSDVHLAYQTSARYLGVIFDRRLNFKEHLEQKCAKAVHLMAAAMRAMDKSWGLSVKTTR